MDPWDRQERETDSQYAQFLAYRDQTARSLPRDPDGLKLAKANKWVTRARAWDDHWSEVRSDARLAAITEVETALAQEATELALMSIQAAAYEVRALLRRQSQPGDGSAASMQLKEAIALMKTGMDLYLKVQGKPTEHITHDVNVKDMALDELLALADKLK